MEITELKLHLMQQGAVFTKRARGKMKRSRFGRISFADYATTIECPLYHSVIDRIKELNKAIKDDSALGRGFEIGHSYFTFKDTDIINDDWVKNVVEYEIIPLIEEYWFDNEAECSKWKEKLYHTIGEPYDE